MEGERKNINGSQPEDVDFEYLVRVGMQPNFASIEIIPPLKPEHEEKLVEELGKEEGPIFLLEEDKSVLLLEPSEPMFTGLGEYETQESETINLMKQEAAARGIDIGEGLLKIAGVEVTYGPVISAHIEEEKKLLAA